MKAPNLVIIGGSAAGVSAAQAAVEAGLAGRVTLISAEPFLPYKRTKISKSFAAGYEPGAFALKPPEWFRRQGVELLQGRTAVSLDLEGHELLLDDQRRIPWGRLIIATGATPRRLALPPPVFSQLHHATSKAQVVALREAARLAHEVLVVGTGVLGTEVAEQLVLLGKRVTMLGEDQIMMGRDLDDVAAGLLARTLRENGVELLLGETARVMERCGEGLAVELSSGRQVFDAVVSCIGMVPAAGLCREAGLRVNQGVLVDPLLRTSQPHVFAAGDVAEHPGGRVTHLWRHALHQGRVAGLNVAGAAEPYHFEPFRLKCKVFEHYFFSLGLPDPAERGRLEALTQQEGQRYRRCYFHGGKLRGLVMCDDEPNQQLYNLAVVEQWDRRQLEQRSGWPT